MAPKGAILFSAHNQRHRQGETQMTASAAELREVGRQRFVEGVIREAYEAAEKTEDSRAFFFHFAQLLLKYLLQRGRKRPRDVAKNSYLQLREFFYHVVEKVDNFARTTTEADVLVARTLEKLVGLIAVDLEAELSEDELANPVFLESVDPGDENDHQ